MHLQARGQPQDVGPRTEQTAGGLGLGAAATAQAPADTAQPASGWLTAALAPHIQPQSSSSSTTHT
ncbi:hypothetical protein GX50_02864 [[Emmonsia] crescens]|uniref:Uncharacterized protein n=1 Tax=[Emmonsia] crescens TaxID=73230 RepID=A0A2B7ZLP9_9EURO|nr:hypothetical protein GX50_02864 [Emmonsia crescens]